MRRAALFGGVGLVAALGFASLILPPADAVPPPASPAPPLPAWIDIDRPLQLFTLAGSPFARLPLRYAARRRTTGVERQDVMTYGRFAESAYLRLAISRTLPAPAPTDLVVDYARAAAADGLALMRAGLPTTLPTRFGNFDIADITLRQGERVLPCLGFLLDKAQGGPIGILGLACGSAERPVDRTALACALDRIDLVEAGEDGTLREAFVEAERRRGRACTARAL